MRAISVNRRWWKTLNNNSDNDNQQQQQHDRSISQRQIDRSSNNVIKCIARAGNGIIAGIPILFEFISKFLMSNFLIADDENITISIAPHFLDNQQTVNDNDRVASSTRWLNASLPRDNNNSTGSLARRSMLHEHSERMMHVSIEATSLSNQQQQQQQQCIVTIELVNHIRDSIQRFVVPLPSLFVNNSSSSILPTLSSTSTTSTSQQQQAASVIPYSLIVCESPVTGELAIFSNAAIQVKQTHR